jgi:hypothetical protein
MKTNMKILNFFMKQVIRFSYTPDLQYCTMKYFYHSVSFKHPDVTIFPIDFMKTEARS